MVKKFKSTFALTAILMVTVLLSGCFGVGRTKTFTLTVNVVPEGAAAVSGVADKYDEKAIAQFTLEAAEGYEFVEWTGDDKPVYNDEDEVWEIVMDGDKTLTAVFKEIEEEPVDPEPVADEEAAAAVDAQITALDKEVGLVQYKNDVAAARAAYEALNAETKALVTKLVLLEVHEDQLDELLYGEVTEFVIAEKVMDGIDLTADVLEDITLGSNFTYDGTVYQVTWESDKPEIITADGTVNRPYGEDVEVTLTATLDFIGTLSTLSADQKNVFEIKLNVVGIRFDLAVENGSVTATLNDLTGLDAVTADDFAITFAIADEAVEAEDLKVEYKDGVATWTFTPFERGLEDYKVDIAVTFGEFEEKDSLEFVGLAVIVETVDAIDTEEVEVTITASDVDRFAQTVEVLDNKGNEVKVKAVDIPAGETKLVFVFEDTIEKQEGVWTIGGVEYDFDLVSNLAAFRATTSQLELNKVLTDLGIEGVVAANMPEYVSRKATFLTKLDTDKKELTVEAIQTWIEEVNAAIIKEGEETTAEEAAAKAVQDARDAGNDLALLAALQNPLFERVNADWFDDYKTKLTNDDETVTDIQEKINEVNDGKIEALTIDNNVDTDDLLKSKALIIKYATPTEKGEQTQDTKDALEEIEIQLAVADVLTATTPTTLKAKLVALDNLLADADKFMEDYVDANGKYYLNGYGEGDDAIAGLKGNKVVVSVTGVTDVLTRIDEAIAGSYIEAVKGAVDADKLLAALKAYPGLKNVADANKAFYFTTGEGEGVGNQFSTVTADDIQDKVDECNLEAVKGAADADKLLAALKVLGVKNIVDANKTAYYGNANNFAAVTADDVQSTLNDINTVVAVNSAKTADAMRTALAPVALADAATATDYLELTAAAKLEVADLFLAVKAGDRTNFTDGKYAAVADIDADLKTVTDDYKGLLSAVNTADSIAGMAKALGDLGIEAFDNLNPAAQLDAAEAFLDAFPKDEEGTKIPYTTLADIEAAIK